MDNVRESTEDLKNQLYHERTEGRRKLIAEKKKGSEGRDKNLSQKWKSILPGISASNSQKSKPDPEVNVMSRNTILRTFMTVKYVLEYCRDKPAEHHLCLHQ